MSDLRFTLLSDGSSDRALIPILTWLLRQLTPMRAIQSEWADLRRLPERPNSLAERIIKSVELYPCDLLFVHRDAERQPLQDRVDEINNGIEEAKREGFNLPTVSVVPIRMQEAWLLFDEAAIRRATGNPNGTETLRLPPLRQIERIPNPKAILHGLLRTASGLRGRRLRGFNAYVYAPKVTDFIGDFTPLEALTAFKSLQTELSKVVSNEHWDA
jgi:hypothetical protein